MLFPSKALFGNTAPLDYSLHMLLPFLSMERNLTLSSLNQVQVHSYTFVARKQRLGALSKLPCNPHRNRESALFPRSALCVPATQQSRWIV